MICNLVKERDSQHEYKFQFSILKAFTYIPLLISNFSKNYNCYLKNYKY